MLSPHMAISRHSCLKARAWRNFPPKLATSDRCLLEAPEPVFSLQSHLWTLMKARAWEPPQNAVSWKLEYGDVIF
jgi:hypothetical protein